MRVNKYRNKITKVDGIRFHSKKESLRFQELKLLVRAKLIRDLQLQVRFPIVVYGVLITTYVCDFLYLDMKTGQRVVEDVKGVKTREYITKKRLMKAVHQIDIYET